MVSSMPENVVERAIQGSTYPMGHCWGGQGPPSMVRVPGTKKSLVGITDDQERS